MLKIVLILVAGFAGTMAVHINVTRTYFWLSENENHNFYIRASPLQKDGEDAGINVGSEDMNIEWIREVSYYGKRTRRFRPEFSLDYGDKYPSVYTEFSLCQDYNQHSIKNFAQNFFNRILADYSRDSQCPLYKKTNILSPGNLQWDRHTSEDVKCDVPVTVTLKIAYMAGNGDYNWAGIQTFSKRDILETVFQGEFTDC